MIGTMVVKAKTSTANHINGEVHLEYVTDKDEQFVVILRDGTELQYQEDVEDAVLEQEHARDRGAAFPRDPGRAA